ncbi:MAG: phenylalanine--tRNA ligase subunit alpha [Nitrososphaeria archaeon]
MGNIALHPLEKRFLKSLLKLGESTLEQIAKDAGLSLDQARRVVEWLREKKLVEVKVNERQIVMLDENGKKAITEGAPEIKLLNEAIKRGKLSLEEAKKLLGNEAGVALGIAIKKNLIKISQDTIIPLTDKPLKTTDLYHVLARILNDTVFVENLNKEEITELEELKKRPKFVKILTEKETKVKIAEGVSIDPKMLESEEITTLSSSILASGKWKELKFSDIDLSQPVPSVFPARIHPLSELINLIKEIMESLGFMEIEGPVIRSSFWNFDVLFTPQDHPARDMHDTFYIKNVKLEETDKDLVNRVKNVHENGWITGSTGWGYVWDQNAAWKALLRTHTTTVTAEAIYKGMKGRIFTVGRVFRNEKPDFKHLVELHQLDAIVIEEEASIRKLMGFLTVFYKKLGFEKVKFWPTFFPYTEPSMQSMIYSEKLKDWIELCGMGIFRPEVTKPLGYDGSVLAWGMGLERLAMLIYDVENIRDFYDNRLSFLRNYKSINLKLKGSIL